MCLATASISRMMTICSKLALTKRLTMLAGAYTPAHISNRCHVPPPLTACQAGRSLHLMSLHQTLQPTSMVSNMSTVVLPYTALRRMCRTMLSPHMATPTSKTSVSPRHTLSNCSSRTSTLHSNNTICQQRQHPPSLLSLLDRSRRLISKSTSQSNALKVDFNIPASPSNNLPTSPRKHSLH